MPVHIEELELQVEPAPAPAAAPAGDNAAPAPDERAMREWLAQEVWRAQRLIVD